MPKIAILTRTTTINSGTILQNLALQHYLEQLGYYALTIDDKNPRLLYKSVEIDAVINDIRLSFKERTYYFLLKMLNLFHVSIYKKRSRAFNRFKQKNIKYYTVTNFNKLNDDFDVFIAGSDQIWTQAAEPEMYKYFMLNDIKDKRKISYAVSVGEISTNSEWVNNAKQLLEKFDAISVRENQSRQNIAGLTSKDIKIVCDPVLLPEKTFWNRLASNPRIHKKYILCYFLSNNEWYFDVVKQFQNKVGHQILIYQKDISKCDYKRANIYGPEDFLGFIKEAEFVLTDSYHCMLFSIIFNKNFFVFQRYNEKNNTQNSRLIDFLNMLDLGDRYIINNRELCLDNISYGEVNKNLNPFISQSKKFINGAI